MKEVGSEYHWEELNVSTGMSLPKNTIDSVLTFSGRTAYELILKNNPEVKKALLPSYCCDSMIEPFRKANISVEFFDVFYGKQGLCYNFHIPSDIDVVVWCNYFGFSVKIPDMSDFINRGGIFVEDITHSLFSEHQYNNQSHYLVASLRKWGPLLSGGYCASLKEKINHKPNLIPAKNYIDIKKKALILKKKYLEDSRCVDKKVFLEYFYESNRYIANNYSETLIDNYSQFYINNCDVQKQKKQRIINGKFLYDKLQGNKTVIPLFDIDDMDCPLFFPVIVKGRKRDALQTRLIENNIYCPVHWGKPNADCNSNLYDLELSLICDHRYAQNDMEKIIKILLDEED